MSRIILLNFTIYSVEKAGSRSQLSFCMRILLFDPDQDPEKKTKELSGSGFLTYQQTLPLQWTWIRGRHNNKSIITATVTESFCNANKGAVPPAATLTV